MFCFLYPMSFMLLINLFNGQKNRALTLGGSMFLEPLWCTSITAINNEIMEEMSKTFLLIKELPNDTFKTLSSLSGCNFPLMMKKDSLF